MLYSPPAIINCDPLPTIPPHWRVTEHRPSGQLALQEGALQLYLSPQPGAILGQELMREVKLALPILNACAFDWLLANPGHIPSTWENYTAVLFMGTEFVNEFEEPCVRALYRHATRWASGNHWLCRVLNAQSFAVALRAPVTTI